MAEALADVYPAIADYLIAHLRWKHHEKLLGSFGPSLAQWVSIRMDGCAVS
jgi:hypothetical protein